MSASRSALPDVITQADPWLTPKELAARLGLTVTTLNCWRSRGKGPAFAKLGGVRYRLSVVVAWEQARSRRA